MNELSLEVTYSLAQFGHVVNQKGPIGKINCHQSESLVHGNELLAIPADRLSIAERLAEHLSQTDTDIFHRMVLIDPEITFGLELQVETPVSHQQGKHVVQKSH